jgi:hypothetical protein
MSHMSHQKNPSNSTDSQIHTASPCDKFAAWLAHWFFRIRTCCQGLTKLMREVQGFARDTFDPRLAYLSLDYSDLFDRLSDKPFSGEGTDSIEPLFAEVGRVCAGFERLEEEIVLLFQLLRGELSGDAPSMDRFSKSSFLSKVEMTEEAAGASLATDPTKRDAVLAWLGLCRRAAKIRNKVAHGLPTQLHYVHKGRSGRGAFLMPGSDPRDRSLSGKWSESAYCWSVRQLQEYHVAFVGLVAMMMTVREELAGTVEDPKPHVLKVSDRQAT